VASRGRSASQRWDKLDAVLSADLQDARHIRGIPGGEHLSALREEAIEATRSGEHPKAARRVADVSKRVNVAAGSVSDPARPNLSPFAVGKNAEAALQDQKQLIPVVVHVRGRAASGWRSGEADDKIAPGLSAAELDLNHVAERVEHLPFRALHNRRLCRRCVFPLVHDVLISFRLCLTSRNDVPFSANQVQTLGRVPPNAPVIGAKARSAEVSARLAG
jgi:hypothetical protein